MKREREREEEEERGRQTEMSPMSFTSFQDKFGRQ